MARPKIDPSLDMTRYISDPEFLQAMAKTDPLTLQRLRLNRTINSEMQSQGVVYRRGNPIYRNYGIENPLAISQRRRRKRRSVPENVNMNSDFFKRLIYLDSANDSWVRNAYRDINPLRNIDEDYLLNNVLQIQGQPNTNPNFILNNNAALRFCSSRNYIRCVQLLLDDPRVNIHVDNDLPLKFAVQKGYVSLTQFLLVKGANANRCEPDLALKNKECFQLLLQYGYDINKEFGQCIKDACNPKLDSFPDALQFVLDHGARIDDASLMNPDPNAFNEETEHPFQLILGDYFFDEDLNLRYEESESLIIKNITLLLDHGIDIHFWDDYLLIESIEYKLTNLAKFLLERGADIHAQNDQAINSAIIWRNNTEFIQYLLNRGATNIRDATLIFTVHSQTKDWNIVKLCIENGANVQADNNAAVKKALEEKNGPMIMYLIERGAVLD